MSDHFLSHSNSFGFEMGKDAAGCRAFNRNFIVGGVIMTDHDEKKPKEPTSKGVSDGGTPGLSAEDFYEILHLPACKTKGYCDNCGRCER